MNNIYILSTDDFDEAMKQFREHSLDVDDNGNLTLDAIRCQSYINWIDNLYDTCISHYSDSRLSDILYEQFGIRCLTRESNSEYKIYKGHLGQVTGGDILFVINVKVKGQEVEFKLDCDLEIDKDDTTVNLYDVTDHDNVDEAADKDTTKRQQLHPYDKIYFKYSDKQFDVAKECYDDLETDTKKYNLHGYARSEYINSIFDAYADVYSDTITKDELILLVHYLEGQPGNHVVSASTNMHKQDRDFTEDEIAYILDMLDFHSIDVLDYYVEITKKYSTKYYDFIVICDTFDITPDLQSDLEKLYIIYKIGYEYSVDNNGDYILEFFHYYK